ncbi:MAG: hypothetical protein K1X47_03320 [Cyclobacteriaceae bacterium]|nr:hypothetical protein [Cyclobacteriaceae bacterium]
MKTTRRIPLQRAQKSATRSGQHAPLIDRGYLDEISGGSGSFCNAMLHNFESRGYRFLNKAGQMLMREQTAEAAKLADQMKPTAAFIGVRQYEEALANFSTALSSGQVELAGKVIRRLTRMTRQIETELTEYVQDNLQSMGWA